MKKTSLFSALATAAIVILAGYAGRSDALGVISASNGKVIVGASSGGGGGGSGTQGTLTWSAVSQNNDDSATTITGYNIYSASGSAPSALYATAGAGATSYPLDGLPAGTHYFTVKPVDADGEGAMSNWVQVVTTAPATQSAAAPAFPGAEGFGANATGGRGGTIIKVTNLNDSGAGSFRACATASGARICVFEVSGIINLASQLTISNGNLTIAGQTSPGGILVTGYMTLINASNVIVRHMRFRVGSHRIANGADPETLDSLDIWGPQSMVSYYQDIIVDHCSVGWGVDEDFSMAYSLRRVTVQDNLVHEGLMNAGHPKGQHSKGLFVWGKESAPNMTVSLIRNFIANNYERNPLVNTGDGTLVVDVVNNVAFNFFGGYAMGTQEDGNKVNWTHNYVKRGTSSNATLYEIFHEDSGTNVARIFALGNIGTSRTTQGGSEWTVQSSWQPNLQSTNYRTLTPWAAPPVTPVTMTSSYATSLVAAAGATKPSRDSVDALMATHYGAGTGAYRNNVAYPADFPTYSTPSAPTDADNDGMADSWETSKGLNTGSNDSAADRDSDGYTNIEEYINCEMTGYCTANLPKTTRLGYTAP